MDFDQFTYNKKPFKSLADAVRAIEAKGLKRGEPLLVYYYDETHKLSQMFVIGNGGDMEVGNLYLGNKGMDCGCVMFWDDDRNLGPRCSKCLQNVIDD